MNLPTPFFNSDNPYVGPETFSQDQSHLFFGREKEARDLLSRVLSERLVIFYAQSGAGKSSLINARLIPSLREVGYAILPVGRVGGDLPGDVDTVDNIYLFNLMLSIDRSTGSANRFAYLTLADFLHGLVSDDGEHFVFDELSVSTLTLPGEIAQSAAPYVLIIDQFEEIITSHPGRWNEREDFFRQLDAAMQQDPNLWVVFTLREDYVASIEPYAPLLIDRMRARFYMQRMGIEAALTAIRYPAQLGGIPFAPGVAEQMVNNLRQVRVQGQETSIAGQYVEPMQLQVVCYRLWETVVASRKVLAERGGDFPKVIGESDLAAGDVNQALEQFYDEILATVLAEADILEAGVTERALRMWFDQELISEAGIRNTINRNDAARRVGSMPTVVVDILDKHFILHSESRGGGVRYELVHDRFIDAIRQSNRAWRAKYNNPVALGLQRWNESGQDHAYLLQGFDLQEAERFAARNAGELTDDEKVFLRRSRVEEERRIAEEHRIKRNRRLIIVLTTTFVILLTALTVWAIANAAVAKRQAQIATSRELSLYTVGTLQTDPELSVLLATEAVSTYQTTEAEAALHRTLQNSQILMTLDHPSVKVMSAQFSSDGLRIVTARTDGKVEIWEAISGNKMLSWTAHEAPVWEAVFSPNGAQIATASEDGSAKIWDSSTGQEIRVFLGHTYPISGVAFSHDSTQLATASWDKTVKLWDVETGETTATFAGHTAPVIRLAFSPDDRLVASASDDGTIRTWDRATGQNVGTFSVDGKWFYDVAFGPSGQNLVSGGFDRQVRLWSVDPVEQQKVFGGHTDEIHAVAFSPDGKSIASGANDNLVIIWDVATGNQSLILRGHKGKITDVAFSPDGSQVMSASEDGTARIWNALFAGEHAMLRGHTAAVSAVAFSPDGRIVATASEDSTVKLWDTENWQVQETLRGHEREITAMAYAADGKHLATGGEDRIIRIWDVKTGVVAATTAIRLYWVRALAFSPDSSMLAAGGVNSTNAVDIFDTTSGELLFSLDAHTKAIRGLSFHPAGNLLLSASEDGSVIVWDIATRQPIKTIPTHHSDLITYAGYSPTGEKFVTTDDYGIAKLWNSATGAELATFEGHSAGVTNAAFTPSGSYLMTAGKDRTVRVWDLNTGDEKYTILNYSDELKSLSFSPDGSLAAVASADGSVSILLMELDQLIELARRRVTRSLTDAECKKYLRISPCPEK